MPLRVGVLDIGAAVIVLIVLVLPQRGASVAAMWQKADVLAEAQDRYLATPSDGDKAGQYAIALFNRQQYDWAVRPIAPFVTSTEKNPTAWRALSELANILIDRYEVRDAHDYAQKAVKACAEARHVYCSQNTQGWLNLQFEKRYRVALEILDSGINPRYAKRQFEEAFRQRTPLVHLPKPRSDSPPAPATTP